MPTDVPDAVTVSELVANYESQGYSMSFAVESAGHVRCGACRTTSTADQVSVLGLARAEGPSDPADMAAVALVSCPWCSMAGVLVLGFGPEASLDDQDVLVHLNDARQEGEQTVLFSQSVGNSGHEFDADAPA